MKRSGIKSVLPMLKLVSGKDFEKTKGQKIMETPFYTDFFLVKRGVIMNVAEKAKENKEEKKQFCFVHMFREVY